MELFCRRGRFLSAYVLANVALLLVTVRAGKVANHVVTHQEALAVIWRFRSDCLVGLPEEVRLLALRSAELVGDSLSRSELDFDRNDFFASESTSSTPSKRALAYTGDGNITEGLCEDNDLFIDALGFSCKHWQGFVCDTSQSYSDAEMLEVRASCSKACALCDVRDTYWDIVIASCLAVFTSLVSLVSIFLARKQFLSWLRALIRRCRACLRCSKQANCLDNAVDMMAAPIEELEAYARQQLNAVRRRLAAFTAVCSIPLCVQYIFIIMDSVACPWDVIFIEKLSVTFGFMCISPVMLPEDILGQRMARGLLCMTAIFQSASAVNSMPYDYTHVLAMTSHFFAHNLILLGLQMQDVIVVSIVVALLRQCIYLARIGFQPVGVYFFGRCVTLTPTETSTNLSDLLNFESAYLHPLKAAMIIAILGVASIGMQYCVSAVLYSIWYREARTIAIEGQQTALVSIMKAICDCVVHLNKNLSICGPSPELAALLVRGSGDMSGGNLQPYVVPEDWSRLQSVLLEHSPGGPMSPMSHVLHVRMKDAAALVFKAQIFWSRFVSLNGEARFMLGIAEDIGKFRECEPPRPAEASQDAASAQAIGKSMLAIPENVPAVSDASSSEGSSMEISEPPSSASSLIIESVEPFRVIWMSSCLRARFRRRVSKGQDNFLDWIADNSVARRLVGFISHCVNEVFYVEGDDWPQQVFFGHLRLRPPKSRSRCVPALVELELNRPLAQASLEDYYVIVHLRFEAYEMGRGSPPKTETAALDARKISM
eukprot:TRINITY_DN8593_c0_g1_i3.p1 TRINITY_DN8593_c0_g1~~TRINITY_DN8593_c0_g1_i3.p1  ORF type:complete len:771 (-),score=77.37 TRINITY_DN8593_c0_g1_i3:271-2583(-)